MLKINKQNMYRAGAVILVFFIGWLARDAYNANKNGDARKINFVRDSSSEFQFTKPLLFVDNSELEFSELNDLQETLNKEIGKEQHNGNSEKVSVYFRDLNTSAWTGVNEDEHYMPSSMLKIAVLMTYLKLAEDNSGILLEEFFYDPDKNNYQHFAPASELSKGFQKAEILLGQMIRYSDDAATTPLSLVREKEITELYSKLLLPIPPENLNDFMSAKAFSRLFRALFNASYVNRSYSEQALKLLTETNFNIGLVAGVGSGIVVAHKFGEHTIYYENSDKKTDYELHDCGIIYYPNSPYLLCVMTKGKDFDRQAQVIKNISKIVFDYMKTVQRDLGKF